jgi:hypothetical protein
MSRTVPVKSILGNHPNESRANGLFNQDDAARRAAGEWQVPKDV